MAEACLGQIPNQAAGAEVPPAEQMQMRAQQAVYILRQAAEYRRDAELMTAVRILILKERDDLAVLLDEL